ncbi:MAG: lipid IV(A) 3-deoxy-D-manno-octulosonic acid transferase [Pseudomonadota bacterium]
MTNSPDSGDADGDIGRVLARPLYLLLSYALLPVLLAVVGWRVLTRPPYRERVFERFGWGRREEGDAVLWVHAVSVGEAQAALPLIRALRAKSPDACVVITTTTPTGAAHVARLYGDSATHRYVPYDLRDAVSRFLDRVRPSVLVVVETELWPHMLQGCRRRRIPVVFANARLTDRSLRRYRRFGALFRDALRDVVVAAQSEADAQRFRALAPPSAQVQAVGNLKFDIALDPKTLRAGRVWRARQGERDAVLVAGSTHEGEEQAVMDALRVLQEAGTNCLAVIVPRHPERFEAVAKAIHGQGFPLRRRSELGFEMSVDDAQVLLVDVMGELLSFYAAADIAFVGGSLVPVGGHNLLEPAALGLPTLTGPHHHNAPEVAAALAEAGALRYVEDGRAIAGAVAELLADPPLASQMGEAGRQTVAANRGAVAAVVERVEALRAAR